MAFEKSADPKPLFPELRAWMERTGTRQNQLAKVLNVSEPSLTNYLSGETEWPTETALQLSLWSGVPVDRFVSREAARLLKLWGKQSNPSIEKVEDNDGIA